MAALVPTRVTRIGGCGKLVARAALLDGKRVLAVEDEPILAMSIEDMLSDLGCIVVGPALTLGTAERLVREEHLDAALLDINMGDGLSIPLAHQLKAKGVPFCFSTGYGQAGVPAELAATPVLPKPFTREALERILERLVT